MTGSRKNDFRNKIIYEDKGIVNKFVIPIAESIVAYGPSVIIMIFAACCVAPVVFFYIKKLILFLIFLLHEAEVDFKNTLILIKRLIVRNYFM